MAPMTSAQTTTKKNSQNTFAKYSLSKIYLFFFVFTFILYGSSIKNEYSLDDDIAVTDAVIKKGVKAIPELFSSPYYKARNFAFGYRPMVKVSYAIENSLFGGNPHVSHFFNLILYWIACCLLLQVLIRLMGETMVQLSALIVFLFLLHPLHTEVVCSLKNRDILFSFIFSQFAYLCYLNYLSTKKYKFIFGGMIAIACAGLSKEDSPVYCLLIPFALFYFKETDRADRVKIISSFLLLFVIGYIIQAMGVGAVSNHKIIFFENPLFSDPVFWHRIPVGFYSFAYYLRLLIIPYPLISYYGYSHIPILPWNDWRVILSAVVTVVLLVYCITLFRKKGLLLFGILCFALYISIYLNVGTPVTGIIAERHAFNASIGFCIVTAVLLFNRFKVTVFSSEPLRLNFFLTKGWFTYILVALTLVYSVMVVSRNPDWKDLYTLTGHDINNAPNSVQLQNLYAGCCQVRSRNPVIAPDARNELINQALLHYRKSIELYPNQANVLNNIGTILAGDFSNPKEANFYFLKAVEMDSSVAEYFFNAGLSYESIRDSSNAGRYFKNALRVDSAYVNAYNVLTELYINTGQFGYAVALSKIRIRKGVDPANAYLAIGNICLLKGDTVNALSNYEQCLLIDHTNSALSRKLANYYSSKGMNNKADIYRRMADSN